MVPSSIHIEDYVSVDQKFDLDISGTEKIVLFVGRLSYYNGVEYLIEAMQSVNAKLLIAGDGKLREKLENMTVSLGLEERVKFLGKVSNELLKYCYQICDVFVLPSVEPTEAFGLVQLEAMAYGKPVINTLLPTGVPFVSIDGKTGLTVEPRNSKALADAINKLLSDDELRKKFGIQARNRVVENFTVDKMNEKILKVYQELMY